MIEHQLSYRRLTELAPCHSNLGINTLGIAESNGQPADLYWDEGTAFPTPRNSGVVRHQP